MNRGYVKLQIDCSKMGVSAIETLAACLRKFLKVNVVGGDTIYAEGKITNKQYLDAWSFIDLFQCKVIL